MRDKATAAARRRTWRPVAVLLVVLAAAVLPDGSARAQVPTRICDETLLTMSDGVRLYGWASRLAPEEPRPTLFTAHTYHNPVCPSTAIASTHVIDRAVSDRFNLVAFDTRGTGASEGEFDGNGPRTQEDFRELIRWARQQPWSDGRIVLHGFSGTAFHAALNLREPGVVAAVFGSTCADMYRCFRRGGAWSTVGDLYLAITEWLYGGGLDARDRLGTGSNPTPAQQYAAIERMRAEWTSRDVYDEFAADRSGLAATADAAVPVLFLTDPYDIVQNFDAYQLTTQAAAATGAPAPRLSLGIGHTTQYRGQHFGRTQELIGAPVDRFVAHYGLGEANGIESEPSTQVVVNRGSLSGFDSGDVTVRSETAWPLPDTDWTSLYLGAGRTGSAESVNDGALTLEPPTAATAGDTLAVVPAPNAYGGDLRLLAAADREGLGIDTSTISDQRRPELTALTYTTPPLTQDLEVTGPVTLRLFATTALPDFDWVVRVTDVWPDGRSEWITDGYLRASLRAVDADQSLRAADGTIVRPWHTFANKQAVPPNEPVEYLIPVVETANVFQAGHRIRVDVLASGSGTDAPRTGGVGAVTVLRDAAHASSLLVPVIPARCQLGTPLRADTTDTDVCAPSMAAALSATP